MSGLVGGGSSKSVSNVIESPIIGSLRVQTSAQGKCVPVCFGQPRVAPNLIWYGAFTAIPHSETTSSGGGGGKGGGGGGGSTTTSITYTYKAAVLLGLCQAGDDTISSVGNVWAGKDRASQASLGLTFFTGSYSQSPFSYLSTNFPAQALSYHGLSYLATGAYDLGDSASLPNHTFELKAMYQYGAIASLAKTVTANSAASTLSATAHGFSDGRVVRIDSTGAVPTPLETGVDYFVVSSTANSFQLTANAGDTSVVTLTSNGTGTLTTTPRILDANPKNVVETILSDSRIGIGFPDALYGNFTSFSNFCVASGIMISPAYTEQKPAQEWLAQLAQLCSMGIVYSDNQLKLIPYADANVVGNGVTFTAAVTPVYDLTDDDYLADEGEVPVRLYRKRQSDAFNTVSIKFYNRFYQYNEDVAEAKDQAAIDLYGLRPMPPIPLYEIADPNTAKLVAQMILQRVLYVRNTYEFRLGWKYCLLEPMDLVTLTDEGLGLDETPVRITQIDENEDGDFTVYAEDFISGATTPTLFPTSDTSGYAQNYNVEVGDINTPLMFVAPFALTNGNLEVWMGISNADDEAGGAEIWASTDDATYKQVGVFYGNSRTGVLTGEFNQVADPDNVSVLGVNLSESEGELIGGSQQDANLYNTLCYVGDGSGGELISFVTATLTAPNQYNLSSLRRGVYGSVVQYAQVGTKFLRVDDAVAKIGFPPEWNGRTIYVKFLAFNNVGNGKQALADVSAYQFSLSQQYAGLPAVKNITGLQLYGQGLDTEWLGRDAKFQWRQSSSTNSFDVGSEPFGGNSGGNDPYFKDYKVIVLNGSTVLRTEYVLNPEYTYTYEKNFEDTGGVPLREFTLTVYARGQQGQLSAIPAILEVSNPVPATPSDPDVRASFKYVFFGYVPPSLTDWAGIVLWMSTTPGFTPTGTEPGVGNCVYNGTDPLVVLDASPGVTYYLRYACYDTFGVVGINASQEFSAITSTVEETDIGDAAITTTKIADDAITTPKLVANAIVANKIAANAITAVHITANAITATAISADAVTAEKIAANAVTAVKISVSNLSAISANLGVINAGTMNIGSGNFVVEANGVVNIQSAANGARLTIANNVIKVYDSAGNLRVQMGDLTA